MNTLMHELAASSIRIEAHGQRLRIDAPAGTLTQELVERIKTYKADLLIALRQPANDILTAAEDDPPPDTDDRHTCRACRYLRAGHCTARRHGIDGEASFRFRPYPDLPRRCAGFVEASSC